MDKLSVVSNQLSTIPNKIMQMNGDEVEVWQLLLPLERSIQEKLESYLSAEEIKRRDRFRFDTDKIRYSIARGGLRDILSRYLAIKPFEFDFSYTEQGKPYLKSQDIQFNVSHSHNMILYAISKHRAVGIDVEYCKKDLDFLALAQTFCSPLEYQQLLTLPKDALGHQFYQFWTRKEAFVKGIGQGMSFPLKHLDITPILSKSGQLNQLGKPIESHFLGYATISTTDEEKLEKKLEKLEKQLDNIQLFSLDKGWIIQDIALEGEGEEYFAAIALENGIFKPMVLEK